MKRLNHAYANGEAEAIGNLVRQWETSPYAVPAPSSARPRPGPGRPQSRTREQRLDEARETDLARLMEQAFLASMRGRDLLAELRAQAEQALHAARSPRGGTRHLTDQGSAAPRRSIRVGADDATDCYAGPRRRTWVAWLLLAVFVVLAGPDRRALARAGPAPERPGLRRAGRLGRRFGDHRRAPDGRPHARRAHAARLRPGPDRGRSSRAGTRRWASTSASTASRASATSSSSATRAATSTRPATAPTTACRSSASPARAWPRRSRSSTCPGLDLCSLTKTARRHARHRQVQRARGHLEPTGTRCSRSSRRSTAAAACRRRARAPRSTRPAGSSASSTPSRSCAPRSPARPASP